LKRRVAMHQSGTISPKTLKKLKDFSSSARLVKGEKQQPQMQKMLQLTRDPTFLKVSKDTLGRKFKAA
jgi:hypothetical protein